MSYQIQYGDTLSGIAKKYNTDVNTLMNLNPYITNANKIYAGKSLSLPKAPTLETPAQQITQQAPVQQAVQQPVVETKPVVPEKTTQELATEYANNAIANNSNETQNLLGQYEKIAEQQKESLANQNKLAVGQINSQRDTVKQTYDDNARQAYINSMLAKKSIEQELSQRGLNTSGLVGSAYADIESAYGNNLATLQKSRDNSVNEIDKQLNENQLKYAIQENELLTNLENAKIELQKYNNQLAEQKYQNALNQYLNFASLDYNKSIDDRNYNYQTSRDQIADNKWNQEFGYNKLIDDRNYNYQTGRDSIADSQWQQEFDFSKKKANSTGSSTSKTSSSSTDGKYTISDDKVNNNNQLQQEATPQELLAGMKIVQGPNVVNNVYDSFSKKYFKNLEELLNYHGYASVE